jgi:PAS domain S-box-containing protein
LWIGTRNGGLIRLHGGIVTTYLERDGLPSRNVRSIREDAEGKLWINTISGVACCAGGKLRANTTYRGKTVAEFFLQARDGSMWFRSATDVVRFGADGSIATLAGGFMVEEARDGSVWVAFQHESRLVRYHQGVFSEIPLTAAGVRQWEAADRWQGVAMVGDPRQAVLAMATDTDGELLLLTPAGLVRAVDGRLSPPESLPLPANIRDVPKVLSLMVDREGNRWVGTVGRGLFRFRRAPLTAYGKNEGLSDSPFRAVFQDRDGRIWLGGDAGVYWFDGHRFYPIPGLAEIGTIAQTNDGDLWFGGSGAVYRWRSGVLTRFRIASPGVFQILQDREGTLWIVAPTYEQVWRLYRFREGEFEQIDPDVVHMAEDRGGGLWLGGVNPPALRFVRGGKTVRYDQSHGMPPNGVHSFFQEPSGALWFSTATGLYRLRDGRIGAITARNGLSTEVTSILDDDVGNLWLPSEQGIFRLSLKEVNDVADGKISSVPPISYGVAEGMKASECNGGIPGACKGRDGRLWFPTMRGVVAIDPNAVNGPPPVVLEEAWAKNVKLGRDSPTSVPAGSDTFDFTFTALDLSAPERQRFKYRLEPFDKDWVDAGTRRTAHYTNMPPGEYSFQVIAANSSGIWNDRGAGVRFALRPFFYQTNWFYALCAIGFLALLWAAYQFRVRQLQRAFKQLQDVIETIPAMAWTALPDGSNAFVNRRWAEYTGLSAEETAGSGWTAAVHPEDRQLYGEKWRASLVAGEPFEFEARFRSVANGEYRWFLGRGVPLRDRHGKILRWYGILTDIEDRKRAEQTLRESETRFRTLSDHAPDAIFVYDFELGTIVDVNPQACEGLGYTRQELLGTGPLAFHPDLGREAMESVADRAAAGETVFDTHWHRRKDGTMFPVEVHTSLYWYGGRRYLLKIARDIGDRLRAEEAVHRSEKQLRDAIDTIPAFVWSASPDGSVDFINRRMLEFSGSSFEAALGFGWKAAIHPEDRDHYLEVQRAAVASGQAFDVEARLRRADGQYRWLLFHSVPLCDETGTVVKRYGVSTDIDDRKRAEQALRRSEAYLADAQRLTQTGSWAWDPATREAFYWSEEMFRIFGFNPQKEVPDAEAFLQRIHPDDFDHTYEVLMKATGGNVDYEHEHRIVLPDGTVKNIHAIGHPVLDQSGRVVEYVGTAVDITERKRAEEALRRSESYLADAQRLTHTGVWAGDRNSKPLYWSEEVFRIFGFDPQQGLPAAEEALKRIHPEDFDKFQRATINEKGYLESEYRIVLPDGTLKYVFGSAHSVLDRNGEIVEVVGVIVDITERKRAEEEVRNTAAQWQATFDAVQDLVLLLDKDFRILRANHAAAEFLGLPFDKIIGGHCYDLIHGTFAPPVECPLARMRRSRTHEEAEVLARKGGPWLSVSVDPIFDPSGELTQVVHVARDITERKRVEEALRQSEERLRLTLEATQIGIFDWDVAHDVWYASPVYYTALGYEPREGPGNRAEWLARLHPDDHDLVTRMQQDILAGETDRYEYEARLRHADGSYRWLQVKAVGIEHDSDGKISRELGVRIDITERKRAEEALRRSEAYLAEAQRLSHTGSWVRDKTGETVYLSEELYRIFEIDPQEGLPSRETLARLVHPDDLDRVRATIEKALREKVDVSDEYRIVLLGGTVKHLQVVRHPVLNHAGDVVELLGTLIDITERKRAEEALRRSEAYLADSQRLTHTGSWAGDNTMKTLYWSEEHFRIFGFDPQQGLPTQGRPFERIHPEDLDKVLQAFDQAINGKVDAGVEYRIVLPDGSLKYVQSIGHPVLNADGEVVEVVGTTVDITERKRAEEALRRSEAYLAEAQRLTHTGAWATDARPQPLYWSQELFRLYGLDPQQGFPMHDEAVQRVHPEDRDRYVQAFHRVIHQKVDSDVEFRTVLPDGTIRYLYGLGHPILNMHGDVVEVVGTTVDITERKRAEQERERLRQLEADLAHINRVNMMGELTASIAHEVNQPLSGIVSNGSACLRWLAGDPPNVEEVREAVRDIVRDGKRAGEVIARIRALTRRAAPPREELDLNETIREVLALVGDEAKRRNVTIRTQFADEVVPVSGDRVQLQQVVLNLVMNAIEAMSCVGERPRLLVVSTRNIDPDQVEVTVEDSGTGLDPNTMSRIFEPFYTTKSGGMGMGLSISRSILQNHGGRLWATAKDGPGTSFHFTLPKHHAGAPDARAARV